MHRFFSPSENITKDKITILDKGELHHMKDVLHLAIGEEVIVFDQRGNEYNCTIKELKSRATLTINEKLSEKKEKGKMSITVACAIPKAAKMEDIIDKLTQLGVERIIPLETERVIVRLDKGKKDSRLLRWQRVALGASKQSQRSLMPNIEPVKKLKEVLVQVANYELKIIPTLQGEKKRLKDIFSQTKPKNIIILIGPEGDFTPGEVDLARNAGFIPVTLGDTVLRVDTAAIAVASFIKLSE